MGTSENLAEYANSLFLQGHGLHEIIAARTFI